MATPTTLPATFVAGNVLTAAQMNDLRGAFRVLQIASGTASTPQTTTSLTYVDVTGVTATLTPSSTSSKILVLANIATVSNNNTYDTFIQLLRGSTGIAQWDGNAYWGRSPGTTRRQTTTAFLDSPNTTSATTYKIQFRTENAITNIATSWPVPTLTIMEISA